MILLIFNADSICSNRLTCIIIIFTGWLLIRCKTAYASTFMCRFAQWTSTPEVFAGDPVPGKRSSAPPSDQPRAAGLSCSITCNSHSTGFLAGVHAAQATSLRYLPADVPALSGHPAIPRATAREPPSGIRHPPKAAAKWGPGHPASITDDSR